MLAKIAPQLVIVAQPDVAIERPKNAQFLLFRSHKRVSKELRSRPRYLPQILRLGHWSVGVVEYWKFRRLTDARSLSERLPRSSVRVSFCQIRLGARLWGHLDRRLARKQLHYD